MSRNEEYITKNIINYLKEIIDNFDSFETNKKYVWKYNKHLKDYEYELHKLNEKMIFMYILNNKIEIVKKEENKFEVIINLNNFTSKSERERLRWFTKYENRKYRGYLLLYYRTVWHIDLGNLVIPIRRDKNILKLTIIKKSKKYYLALPDLEMREIPDRKYGFPIKENLYYPSIYLNEINGKKVEKIIENAVKKKKNVPYINKVKLKNRKIEYAIFRMMLNKGILQPRYRIIPYSFERIYVDRAEEFAWMFTNMIMLTLHRITGGQFPDFAYATLQDFGYDGVNQILMKFIDEFRNSYLCGVDYSNRLWCMRLPGFMYKYKIKSVYRVLYNLDENTKLFEF